MPAPDGIKQVEEVRRGVARGQSVTIAPTRPCVSNNVYTTRIVGEAPAHGTESRVRGITSLFKLIICRKKQDGSSTETSVLKKHKWKNKVDPTKLQASQKARRHNRLPPTTNKDRPIHYPSNDVDLDHRSPEIPFDEFHSDIRKIWGPRVRKGNDLESTVGNSVTFASAASIFSDIATSGTQQDFNRASSGVYSSDTVATGTTGASVTTGYTTGYTTATGYTTECTDYSTETDLSDESSYVSKSSPPRKSKITVEKSKPRQECATKGLSHKEDRGKCDKDKDISLLEGVSEDLATVAQFVIKDGMSCLTAAAEISSEMIEGCSEQENTVFSFS